MKSCPQCGGRYPVAEGFCPMDGARLRTLHAEVVAAEAVPAAGAPGEWIGRVLDRRYRLDQVIGEGGMGLVFRATHVHIGKAFAIKVLRREHLDVPDVARRFVLEAQVASSLKHPNVVDISDFGETPDGGAYYVMELLEGRTLAVAIDEGGPMPVASACGIALQIAHGLGAAHARGVVHRDLKPDNVFLCEPRSAGDAPRVKLLDFGIARAGPRRITVTGALLGTPEYMSPEMALGNEVDPRADLYALGIILFEMLTGRVPFYAKEIARVLEMHMVGAPPHLADRKPELARLGSLDALIHDLLKKSADDRPSSAREVIARLGGALVHDLGDEAAARVQRQTLAIGSNALPEAEVAGAGDAPAWEERGAWKPAAAAAAAVPTPAPMPAPVSSIAVPIGIGVGVAVLAAGIVLAIAQPWRTPLAAPEEPVVFERPAPQAPAPSPRPEKVVEPSTVAVEHAPAPVPPTDEPPVIAETPEPADVTPIAASASEDEDGTPIPVEHGKSTKRKPRAPVDAPGKDPPQVAKQVPPAPEPPTPSKPANPKVPPPPPIDDRPPAKAPGDLKDPFPAN